MYEYVAEAFVAVAHAQNAADAIITQVRDFCEQVAGEGSDRYLDFGDGRAIIRAIDDHLLFRICACDTVIFYGIRTILEGSLFMLALLPKAPLEWHPGGETPFSGAPVLTPLAVQRMKRG